MIVDVNGYLPLFRPLRGLLSTQNADLVLERRKSFLAELPSIITSGWYQVPEVSVPKLADPPDDVIAYLNQLAPLGNLHLSDVFEFKASVEVDVDALQAINNHSLELDQIPGLAAVVVSDSVEQALALSEISSPGSVCSLQGLCLANGASQSIDGKSWFASLVSNEHDEPA